MDGDDDSHAGDGYTTPDGIGDISSIAQFMQGLAVQTRPTSNRLEWDGNQEGWKDFWFRFESHVCVSKNIKSEVLDPEHTPSTAARVKLYHELVGLLTTPASGKPSKALQILKGFISKVHSPLLVRKVPQATGPPFTQTTATCESPAEMSMAL